MKTTTSTSKLAMPLPDDCSEKYASGWALADRHSSEGIALGADVPPSWDEEKLAGYRDRLSEEHESLSTFAP